MKIARHFTKAGQDPLEGIPFVPRTSRITKLDGTVVFEAKGVLVPETWSQVAVDILAQKYFRRKGIDAQNGGEKDARQVFHRLAGCWRHWGETHGYFDSADDAQAFYDELTYMLANQMCAPNSPQWFNTGLHFAYGISGPAQGHSYVDPATGEMRKSSSAYERPQPHACFIQSVADDLVNEGGIMDLWTREARIFKYGSGTGTNFSKVRGSEEPLSGGGRSSGLMSFLAVGDRAAGAIKSGGTTRRAAKMVCLDLDHPDIEAFIDWKVTEERKVAMMAAGSAVLRRQWDALCKAVEGSTVKDADPKTNEALRKALARAKREGAPAAFLTQCLGRLVEGDFERDLAGYDTSWDGEAYYTVGGMNSNNSVRVPDAFMRALEMDGDWDLKRRVDGRASKKLRAKDLWEKVNKAAWACADPGIQFDTTINDWHTCPEDGPIRASNPCSEYMFLDDTACNLASLNLCTFLTADGGFDLAGYRHGIRLWTVVLEISVLMAQFPSDSIAQLSYEFRTLGLGYANLGAMLMRMGIPYDSVEGTQWCAALTAILTGDAYAASAEMAHELGAFPGYAKNAAHMLRVIRNHRRAAYNAPASEYEQLSIRPQGLHGAGVPKRIVDAARESWDTALTYGEQWGFRNAQVTVLAPTGTIGLLMDCDTTGVEPDFALVKFKKLAGGGYFKLVNGAIPEALARLGYAPSQIQDIERYVVGWQQITDETPGITRSMLRGAGWAEEEIAAVEQKLPTAFDPSFALDAERLKKDFSADQVEAFLQALGGTMTVEGAPHLKDEHLPIFDCANRCGRLGRRYIAPVGHLKMMGAAQPFLSGAISKTINLPAEATVGEIGKIYEASWQLMLKAVALYRDGSKMSQAMATNLDLLDGADTLLDEDAAPADKAPVVAQALTQQLVRTYRRRMPNRRGGYTQAATVGGTKLYLRTGEYEDGSLGEIFLDIHKEGAAFRAVLNCFAIAVSMGLQHGVPLEEFCDAFLFTRFEPGGMVMGSDSIKMSTSIIDFVFRELAISYLGRYDLAHVEADQIVNAATGLRPGTQAPGLAGALPVLPTGTPLPFPEAENTPQPALQPVAVGATKTATAASAARAAREKGYTGDPCPECGHLTLVRNGACMKCQTCGATTGCS
ncbi:adenosylcobalamin-dependent ribonucleoside-diphosphate reductase [Geothrix sp. 21YS21S-4]|uniref:adenosylcobalamin-dependent ribonucleoside-diphosphate reductase n=1 Tax=Geothrix sp. 21YS21S-4 TaxID=3068889 RepID=UPI0027B8EEBE|nr:adenosylcobalamin-dependent ribonucleoside-diphosphate reductase [Geothrix sp. 21YS21S-4]